MAYFDNQYIAYLVLSQMIFSFHRHLADNVIQSLLINTNSDAEIH